MERSKILIRVFIVLFLLAVGIPSAAVTPENELDWGDYYALYEVDVQCFYGWIYELYEMHHKRSWAYHVRYMNSSGGRVVFPKERCVVTYKRRLINVQTKK